MVSCRNISSPSIPRCCIAAIEAARRAASSSREKWMAMTCFPSLPQQVSAGWRELQAAMQRLEIEVREDGGVVGGGFGGLGDLGIMREERAVGAAPDAFAE